MTVVPGPPYPGLYQHFRGEVVAVKGLVVDKTNRDTNRLKVLYERLFDKALLVRDVSEFNQMVHPYDGTPSVMAHLGSFENSCKMCVPRFHQMTPADIEVYNSRSGRKID